MSKVVKIVLTRTIKHQGVYHFPGEVVEVPEETAREILAARSGREQSPLFRPEAEKDPKAPAKSGRKKESKASTKPVAAPDDMVCVDGDGVDHCEPPAGTES